MNCAIWLSQICNNLRLSASKAVHVEKIFLMSQQEYDLIVIGAGSGGVRAARMSAAFGANVAVVESRYLGGTCVNVGCVPKKLFSYAAHFAEDFHDAQGFGWQSGPVTFDWATLRDNKTREIQRLNGIYQTLLEKPGVDIIRGHGRLISPREVQVGEPVYRARNILLAVGGWPFVPDIPGREHAITSNEIFYLDALPAAMTIVGGGYIATEFASILAGLGVKVTQIYRRELFLRGFDSELRQQLAEEMRGRGIDLRFNENVDAITPAEGGQFTLTLASGGQLTTGAVLYATGRRPLLTDLGLENTGVTLDSEGYINVNPQFETEEPGIFALGDVTGGTELTPVALAEGMNLARRLFNNDTRSLDYTDIPTAIFSLPNLATVGLSEDAAREQGRDIAVYTSRFTHLKHTLSGNPTKTFLKLVVEKGSDRVLGAHMMGDDAGEIIQGLAVAIKAGATKADFDNTLGIHPTVAEEFVTMREATR